MAKFIRLFAERGQERNRSRLLLKTYLCFAFMVILVAAIIGSIFLEMYQDTTRRQYRTQLSNQAERVKARFQEFIRNEDYQGCLSYLEILQEIEQVEIWSLANPYSDNN